MHVRVAPAGLGVEAVGVLTVQGLLRLARNQVLEFLGGVNGLLRGLDLLDVLQANESQDAGENDHDQEDDQERCPAVQPDGEKLGQEEEKEEGARQCDGACAAEEACTDAALLSGLCQLGFG